MNTKEAKTSIDDIRDMMEKASKFLVISGFSAIFIGLWALAGGLTAWWLLQNPFGWEQCSIKFTVTALALLTFAGAVTIAAVFSLRNAHKSGSSIFSKTAVKVYFAFLMPLVPGAILCPAMVFGNHQEAVVYVPAVMLLLYAVALINLSHYYREETRIMGYCVMAIGCIACLLPAYGIFCWLVGFGVMHIIFGIILFIRYER
ncbi:MAG: hypothetical protein LBV39_04800 [Bacteroidales bacterium]|jgi:hypothetical protein|nr:hypothetical protein [Bacteroidales bacterium]